MEFGLTKNIVFMGTPDFAVPALKTLIAGDYNLAAVVTQPDRPSGRGKTLTPPPVKVVARQAGVPVLQPPRLRKKEAVAQLAAFNPDLIVVAAFGQILRPNVLNLPPFGCINIHASLLPRWRGAAPVAAAILAGDAETGVTLMQMDPGLDTGPMIAKRATPILPTHTTASLTKELAHLGADLLAETLPAWFAGDIEPEIQDESQATLAPRLQKEAGRIDWQQPAIEIERQVRAYWPWPGTFTTGPRGPIKILAVEPAPPEAGALAEPLAPGTVFKFRKLPFVATGNGALLLAQVQPAGKKAMDGRSLLNGQPELWNAVLGQEPE
ncbi:MAG: methionyl-tRNA formyltransferase [Chloroflexi bacterium]|nr:MAG: methionyl-tRNA formyltransferase [Chloroflexota bacterium]